MQPPSSVKRRALYGVNVLIAAGLGVLVVVVSKPWEVWSLEGGFIAAFAASLVLDAALVFVWARRHRLVLAAAGSQVRTRDLGWIVTFSNTANNLTPAASGEVVRAWFLNRKFDISFEKAGAAIAFERIFMFGLMSLSAVNAGVIAAGARPWFVVLSSLGLVLYVAAMPFLLRPLARMRGRQPEKGGRIRRLLGGIYSGGLDLWSDHRVAFGTAAWSVLAFASMSLIFFMAARLSGLHLDAAQTWALVGGGTAVGVVSALPFGLGAAELSAVGIATLIGAPTQEVAAAWVLYRVFFTFPLALAGSFAYGHLTKS